ncbi:GDP-mannose 4,6-dehydratase, partial [bacterium]|nr:GDP-mannose 4,6-dehydratase [bacterium]
MENIHKFNNILITGGYGFIGSNFNRYMIKKYTEMNIINLDALTYAGNPENLKEINNDPRFTFVKGDIRNKNIVDKLMKQCDAIIHFAAESHVDRSILD